MTGGLFDKATLLKRLVPPFDMGLAGQLVDEFISIEKRFVLRDWEPAELDGGQFGEILARIIYHLDSGILSAGKGFDDCARYVENDQVPHVIQPRQTALHFFRVLRTVYKFRSQRGAVHISATYYANQMDAKLMIECVRWLFSETLRLYAQASHEEVARIIREICDFDVPCVGRYEDIVLVQRTDLTAEEEILILLHYAGDSGYTRSQVGKHARFSAPSVTNAIQKLESKAVRQIIMLGTGCYRLTELGAKRVRDELSTKLGLN